MENIVSESAPEAAAQRKPKRQTGERAEKRQSGEGGAPKSVSVLKKLDADTAKLLSQLKDKVNKKSFGRRIRDSEILSLGLRNLTNDHVKSLQEYSLSEKDRLRMAHEEYMKSFGKLTLDQFIGKLLKGEVLKSRDSA